MYLINSPRTRADIDALKSGSTRKRISRGNFANVEIPLAPLNEQHRIVAKIEKLFSELDKGIENLKTARAQLKVYRQAVLKHAFEAGSRRNGAKRTKTSLRRQSNCSLASSRSGWRATNSNSRSGRLLSRSGSEGTAGKEAGKSKKPTEIAYITYDLIAKLPWLPEGWLWVRVGDCCEVVRGGSPRPAGDTRYYNGKIPFLKVADLTRNEGVFLDTHCFSIKEAGLNKTRLVEPRF